MSWALQSNPYASTETAQGARSSLLASWERNQGQICSASQGFGTP